MDLNVGKEVAAMKRMTVNELRAKYADAFGEGTNARHKEWLVRRIAWRMQALPPAKTPAAGREGVFLEAIRASAWKSDRAAEARTRTFSAQPAVGWATARARRASDSRPALNRFPRSSGSSIRRRTCTPAPCRSPLS
jgi:hypothetical protein